MFLRGAKIRVFLFNEAKIKAGVFALFLSFRDLKSSTLNGKPVVSGQN